MEGLMQTLQIFASMGSALGVYIFLKQTGKRDIQELSEQIKMTNTKLDGMKMDMNEMRTDMNREFRDFHGRLCTLEEKYHNIHDKIDSR